MLIKRSAVFVFTPLTSRHGLSLPVTAVNMTSQTLASAAAKVLPLFKILSSLLHIFPLPEEETSIFFHLCKATFLIYGIFRNVLRSAFFLLSRL